MLGHEFYHATLHRMNIAFGSLFTDIAVMRQDASGVEKKRINVPLEYGPKEHWYRRAKTDQEIQQAVAVQFPRMSYDLVNLSYDESRKVNSLQQNIYESDSSNRIKQYAPVPYNFEYNLYVGAKLQTDGEQIIEQILPYFSPSLALTLNLVPSMNLKVDVPITITKNPDRNDNWNVGFDEDRIIEWTIGFTAKSYLYGHTTKQGIIKKIQVDFYTPPGDQPVTDEEVANTPRSERITITPNPSNATPGSSYGYTVVINHYEDGLKFNSQTGMDEEI